MIEFMALELFFPATTFIAGILFGSVAGWLIAKRRYEMKRDAHGRFLKSV